MLLNPNKSFVDLIKLVKLPISEKIPQSDPCSSKEGSKLGFTFPCGKILDSTIPFNKLLETTELTESADTASAVVFAFVLFVAVRLELSLLE
jgi:hypothetical protein